MCGAAQGIVQLGVLFMQMAPIALSLAVVDLMVAAIRWPGVLLIAACAAAVFSAIRASAVALLLSRCALLGAGSGMHAPARMRPGRRKFRGLACALLHAPWLQQRSLEPYLTVAAVAPSSAPACAPAWYVHWARTTS